MQARERGIWIVLRGAQQAPGADRGADQVQWLGGWCGSAPGEPAVPPEQPAIERQQRQALGPASRRRHAAHVARHQAVRLHVCERARAGMEGEGGIGHDAVMATAWLTAARP